MDNLVNKRFGKLVALENVGYKTAKGLQGSRISWRCHCDCGKETIVTANNLCTHATQSCGCYKKEQSKIRQYKNIIGLRFDRLVVIEEVVRPSNMKSKGVYWKCVCDCGNEIIVDGHRLLSKHTKSCGCLRKEVSRQRSFFVIPFSKTRTSKSERLFIDKIEQHFNISIERDFFLNNRYFDGRIGKILIEIDSNYWHKKPKRVKIDALKDKIALQNGFAIIRCRVNSIKEVHKQFKYYSDSIKKVLGLKGILYE